MKHAAEAPQDEWRKQHEANTQKARRPSFGAVHASVPADGADGLARAPGGTDWALDVNGVLTITSDSGMTDWCNNSGPYTAAVKNVIIGGVVETIGDGAFQNCENLLNVVFQGTAPPTNIGSNVFGTMSLNGIYVPTDSVDAYKSALTDYASLICTQNVAIAKNGATTYYLTLKAALLTTEDGDTVTLLADIAEDVVYSNADSKTITIDGQSHTLTGKYGIGLELKGEGTVILKSISLVANGETSVGLHVSSGSANVESLGTVTATGGATLNDSYGLFHEGTGTVTSAASKSCGNDAFSVGVYNSRAGMVNVNTDTGTQYGVLTRLPVR